jgi:hypothetical protein
MNSKKRTVPKIMECSGLNIFNTKRVMEAKLTEAIQRQSNSKILIFGFLGSDGEKNDNITRNYYCKNN